MYCVQQCRLVLRNTLLFEPSTPLAPAGPGNWENCASLKIWAVLWWRTTCGLCSIYSRPTCGRRIPFYITLRKKKVQPQTQEMYQRALIKREELKKQVESEANGSPERIDYLRSLDTVLSYAVRDLKQDLNMSSSH